MLTNELSCDEREFSHQDMIPCSKNTNDDASVWYLGYKEAHQNQKPQDQYFKDF